jgi:PadR family transcriptional regulator, regulatory protein PadR
MEVEKTIAQMRKGVLEYCILALLSKREAYASDIIERFKASHLILVEGTLYPLLTRLKNDGLLSYRWEESRSGPPRKYFQITQAGQDYLAELDKSWAELTGAVSSIANENNSNSII